MASPRGDSAFYWCIEQINSAVNGLDRQTQNNASIASQTKDIAIKTDTIAKTIVEDVNKKEFEGKNSIKNDSRQSTTTKQIPKQIEKKEIKSTEKTIKPVVSNSDEDEWASF